MASKDRFHWGLEIQQQILDLGRTQTSMSEAADFGRDVQTLDMEFARSDVWPRPGLDQRSRSILTLGMLIALNRTTDLTTHMSAALKDGVSVDELREMVLHSAVYCGFPAARDAMRLLRHVDEEERVPASNGKISYFHGEEVPL